MAKGRAGISISLPTTMIIKLDNEAENRERDRSEIVQEALETYFNIEQSEQRKGA